MNLPEGVHVVWRRGRAAAEELLGAEAVRLAGPDAVVGRLCPWCGNDRHGRPVVRRRPDLHLSLSRAAFAHAPGEPGEPSGGPADELCVVASSTLGPVGVDVEGDDPPYSLRLAALHPDETARTAREVAIIWTRKEALLKATGHGLRIAPDTIRLSGADEPPRLLTWPGDPRPDVAITDLEIAPGFVGAVSLLHRPPTPDASYAQSLSWLSADDASGGARGARPPEATR